MLEKINKWIASAGTNIGMTKTESRFVFYFICLSAFALLISSFYSAKKTQELNEAFREIDAQYESLQTHVDSARTVIQHNIQLQKININKSPLSEIEKLPGIGSKTAALIVTYREQIGFYKSNRDLLKIKGIGESKLGRILPFLEPDSLLKIR